VVWSSRILQACLSVAAMVPTGSVACWPWSTAWFEAFELASLKLALGSVRVTVADWQHCCSQRWCCGSLCCPSEE
jgi:hypothetical protein